MKFNNQVRPRKSNVRHSFRFPFLLAITLVVLPLAGSIAHAGQNIFFPTAPSYLFVAATDSNQVTAIDPSTGQVAQYIPVGTNPIRIAMRPDGLVAFVSNTSDNTVSMIDTQTLAEILPRIPVGRRPQGLAVSPNGKRLYVVHESDNRVFVVNATTGAVIGQVFIPPTTGASAKDVLVSPDNRFVYVANYANGSVDVISAANGSVHSIPAAAGPRRLAITPDGAYVLAADYLGDMVTVVDTSTNSFVKNIPVGHQPRGIAITPDGTKTYVTNVNTLGSVSVIRNSDFTVTSTIPVGDTPWHVIVPPAPNNRYAYVSNTGSGVQSSSISIIDTTTDLVVKTLGRANGVGNGPFWSVVNPNGNKLFISNSRETVGDPGGGTVSIIDLRSQRLLPPITNVGSQPFDLTFE
jgi:YVTN family beta-propeller protein